MRSFLKVRSLGFLIRGKREDILPIAWRAAAEDVAVAVDTGNAGDDFLQLVMDSAALSPDKSLRQRENLARHPTQGVELRQRRPFLRPISRA
jgi:hypothetical protein